MRHTSSCLKSLINRVNSLNFVSKAFQIRTALVVVSLLGAQGCTSAMWQLDQRQARPSSQMRATPQAQQQQLSGRAMAPSAPMIQGSPLIAAAPLPSSGAMSPGAAHMNQAQGFGQPPLIAAERLKYFKQITPTIWRTRINASQLFPLVVRQLTESYIVQHSDSRALTVQTDWDKFFLGGRLFRNRMSISLFQVSGMESEIVINNKVEYFQQNDEQTAFGESDWIPTQDVTNEKAQLITSLSNVLHAVNLSARASRPQTSR